jgi:hypothetical protein
VAVVPAQNFLEAAEAAAFFPAQRRLQQTHSLFRLALAVLVQQVLASKEPMAAIVFLHPMERQSGEAAAVLSIAKTETLVGLAVAVPQEMEFLVLEVLALLDKEMLEQPEREALIPTLAAAVAAAQVLLVWLARSEVRVEMAFNLQ